MFMVGVWGRGFSHVSAGATIWGGKKNECARHMFLEKNERPKQLERTLNAFSGHADSLSSVQ